MRRPPPSPAPATPPSRPRTAMLLLLSVAVLTVLGLTRWQPATTPPPPRPPPATFLTRDSPLGARLLPPPDADAVSRPPPRTGGAWVARALDWRDVRDPPPPPRPHRVCPAAGCPSSYDVPTAEDSGGACPVPAPPRGVEDARKGVRPYLFGGRSPTCAACALPSDAWASFCSFEGGPPACPADAVDGIVASLVERVDAGSAFAQTALTLAPCDVWPGLEGRALWIVGDNEAAELARALACFFLEFWDTASRAETPWAEGGGRGEPLPAASMAAPGWCIYLPRATRICHVQARDVDAVVADVVPAFVAGDAGLRRDAMLLNAGVHYTNAGAYRAALDTLARALRTHAPSLPRLLWRDASPQHFKTPDGQWAERVPDGCAALPGVRNDGDALTLDTAAAAAEAARRADPDNPLPPDRQPSSLLTGGWRNAIAAAALAPLVGARPPVVTRVATWNATAALARDPGPLYASYHPPGKAYVDCSHPCHPSHYQAWIVALARELVEGGLE